MPLLIICNLISPFCIYILFNSAVRNISAYIILFLPIFMYCIIRNLEKNSFFDKDYTSKVYGNGFEVIHPNGASFLAWSDIVKVIKLKSVILLFPSKYLVHLIPIRAFSQNPDQYELLLKIITDKVKKD